MINKSAPDKHPGTAGQPRHSTLVISLQETPDQHRFTSPCLNTLTDFKLSSSHYGMNNHRNWGGGGVRGSADVLSDGKMGGG